MVVIVILGILAALVVPARARAARRGARRRGEERHRGDHAGAEALSPRQPALSDRPSRDSPRWSRGRPQPPLPPNWKPNGYLERLPKDPWGHPYQYLNPGPARRDRRLQLRRRRPARRHRDRRRRSGRGTSDRAARAARRAARAPDSRWSRSWSSLVVLGHRRRPARRQSSAATIRAERSTREAKRLAGALEHAAALAQWTRRDAGRVGRRRRRTASGAAAATERWTAIADDDVLAPRAPARRDHGRRRRLRRRARCAADAILPFRASGRNEPYASCSRPARRRRARADALNRVGVAERTPDPP